jgi:hexosaminidase
MKKIACIVVLTVAISASAQQIKIIPQPAEIIISNSKEKFILTKNTKIVLAHGVNVGKFSDLFNEYLQNYYGFKLVVQRLSDQTPKSNIIRMSFNPLPSDNDKPDSYKLKVTRNEISMTSRYSNGLFYGIQTLIQLLPAEKIKSFIIPQLEISDYPRFAYRGMHLDVGRHFFPVSFVKKYIDYLALHKMNYFHWHLTEDQGWRIEIKKYPKLTQVGAWRNGTIIGRYPGTGNDGLRYGGYYTQEEIKDVVAYAQKRYITIIPEIEMPGHSSAAIAAYPELSCFPNESTKHPKQCAWSGDTTGKQVQQTWGVFEDVFCAGKDSTFKLLEDVLDEVMALFPSKYIHVGGDECPKANWKRCPLCQKRIKDEGLKDEHELQSYFIQRIEKYLNSKGRTLIGWDEILEGGLAPKAVVMSWRGEEGGIAAARQKHNVIMTPGAWVYFDHSQSQNEDSVTIGGYTPVEKTYSYEPIPDSLTKEQGKLVLGAQGNVWTEYMGNEKKVEYMIFPRMSALSEVLWSKNHDWKDFERRLMTQFKRYDLWKANYSKAYFDLKSSVLPTEDNNGVYWLLTSKEKGDLDVGRWAHDRNAFEEIFKTDTSLKIKIFHSNNYDAEQSGQGFLSFLQQNFFFNKATGKKITLNNPPSDKYPGDGAFTLVNGIQNEKGIARSKEFLGFNGTDCDALINLDSFQTVTSVTVHVFQQFGSQIWQPLSMEAFISDDGQYFSSLGKTDKFNVTNGGNGTMTVKGTNTGKFVKVLVKNWGTIPQGNPGAGNKPWLFVDEIEIN